MSTLEELIEFHERRKTLSEFGPLAKLASSITAARDAMEATVAREQAEREARLERDMIRPWPMPNAPASPDDVCVYSFVGGLPRFDTFVDGGKTYEFTCPAGTQLAFIPASHAHLLPPQSSGWSAAPAHEMFARPDLLGGPLIRQISSVPLAIALFRRLSGSSGEQAKLASQLLRAQCASLGRDPTQHATPMASFARAWSSQDAQAEKISNMLFTPRDGETVEAIPDDLLESQMRESGAQVRASNAPDKINARMAGFHEREHQLDQIQADLAAIKNATSTATEIPQ